MTRPVIGILGNAHVIGGDYEVHVAGALNSAAVSEVADCIPLIVPTDPSFSSIAELMQVCDGFVFTGARANVHPSEYGELETPAHGEFDRARDAVTLPLIRALIERGQPYLGICRGFQEVVVAMGSTLHPEIRDLPGRDNHRMPPDGTLEEKFAMRHKVSLTQGGPFHRLLGTQEVMTNSLHGQGLKTAGPRVVIDGTAPDDTAEAVYIKDAPGFGLSVQWHPEYKPGFDPVSRPLFTALGQAVRNWKLGVLAA
jgi:putative glutamine amidotransferase